MAAYPPSPVLLGRVQRGLARADLPDYVSDRIAQHARGNSVAEPDQMSVQHLKPLPQGRGINGYILVLRFGLDRL